MRILQRIVLTELVALLSLAFSAALTGIFWAAQSHPEAEMSNVIESAFLYFFATFLFGFIPVTFYGAPAYAWLSHRGMATWWSALLLGAFPGVVLFFSVDNFGWLGGLSLVCGVAVAGLTHLAWVRWVSPNNSFKPNPLRGSA
jgi:hypothetical protein